MRPSVAARLRRVDRPWSGRRTYRGRPTTAIRHWRWVGATSGRPWPRRAAGPRAPCGRGSRATSSRARPSSTSTIVAPCISIARARERVVLAPAGVRRAPDPLEHRPVVAAADRRDLLAPVREDLDGARSGPTAGPWCSACAGSPNSASGANRSRHRTSAFVKSSACLRAAGPGIPVHQSTSTVRPPRHARRTR